MHKARKFINTGIEKLHKAYLAKLRDPKTRDNIRKNLKKTLNLDKQAQLEGGQTTQYSRIRKRYNFFEHQKEISTHLKELLKTKKTIYVLDAGAGDGSILVSLKQLCNGQAHTTAMDLIKTPQLEQRLKTGQIDRIIKRSLEGFTPDREYDLIVSYFGALYYVTTSLKAHYGELLARSLAKGGKLVIYPYRRELEQFKDQRFRLEINYRGRDSSAIVTRIK
jgi:cyclopropane fatty-acyl-phospholipid synthase-like methyltransferase